VPDCRRARSAGADASRHGIIRSSHPLGVAGLIERHPRTRFLLMHLAYPWSRDLLGMAFVYRNIWLDLTWSFLLSPSHFKLALHEAIEVLPNESRMMLGGDNWHVEETYGAMQTARRLIAEVLDEKLVAGYFSRATAERLARRMLHDNAAGFSGRLNGTEFYETTSPIPHLAAGRVARRLGDVPAAATPAAIRPFMTRSPPSSCG